MAMERLIYKISVYAEGTWLYRIENIPSLPKLREIIHRQEPELTDGEINILIRTGEYAKNSMIWKVERIWR